MNSFLKGLIQSPSQENLFGKQLYLVKLPAAAFSLNTGPILKVAIPMGHLKRKNIGNGSRWLGKKVPEEMEMLAYSRLYRMNTVVVAFVDILFLEKNLRGQPPIYTRCVYVSTSLGTGSGADRIPF